MNKQQKLNALRAQLLQAAQDSTGLKAEYYLWAAVIIERRVKQLNLPYT